MAKTNCNTIGWNHYVEHNHNENNCSGQKWKTQCVYIYTGLKFGEIWIGFDKSAYKQKELVQDWKIMVFFFASYTYSTF